MTSGNWLETNAAEDVAGNIRHALRCVEFALEDPQAWKWVILALHAALQGACMCHLTTTAAPLGATTPKSTAEWCMYFENSRTDPGAKPPKQTIMLSLPALLLAIRKDAPDAIGRACEPIHVDQAELAWLKRIHSEIRNQFVHFEPISWSIDLSGVPDIARLIARIIGEILDCGWAFQHMDASKKDAMRADLNKLSQLRLATQN